MMKPIIFLCVIFFLYKILTKGLFPLLAKRSLERYKEKITENQNKQGFRFRHTDSH